MSSPQLADTNSRRIALEYGRKAIDVTKRHHVVLFPSRKAYDIRLGLKMGVFSKDTTVFHCFEKDGAIRDELRGVLRGLGVKYHLYGAFNIVEDPHMTSYQHELNKNLNGEKVAFMFLDYCWSLTSEIQETVYQFIMKGNGYVSKRTKIAITFSLEPRGNKANKIYRERFPQYSLLRHKELSEIYETNTDIGNVPDYVKTSYALTTSTFNKQMILLDTHVSLDKTYTYREASTYMSLVLLSAKPSKADIWMVLDELVIAYAFYGLKGEHMTSYLNEVEAIVDKNLHQKLLERMGDDGFWKYYWKHEVYPGVSGIKNLVEFSMNKYQAKIASQKLKSLTNGNFQQVLELIKQHGNSVWKQAA